MWGSTATPQTARTDGSVEGAHRTASPRTYECEEPHNRCRALVLTRYLRQADSAIVPLMGTNDGSTSSPRGSDREAARESGELVARGSDGEAAREPGEPVARGSDREADREPDGGTAQGQGELVAQAPGATLIEVFPEITLVVGESLSELPDEVKSDLVELPFGVDHVELDKVLGTAGVLAQTASATAAVGNLQGLVRLTPDTVAAMKAGLKPLVSGGNNLGVLTDAGGRFARQVRWKPVGPQVAGGTVLASLGPAFMMVALQLQLSGLEKTAKEIRGIACKILKGMDEDRQDELAGIARVVDRALKEAKQIRSVTPGVWEEVQGQQAKIDKYRDTYRRSVEKHVNEARALKGAPAGEVRAHVMENGPRILTDLECYMTVERINCVYQALRAERLREEGRTNPKDAELSGVVAANAREDYENAIGMMTGLVGALNRGFHLLAAIDTAQSPGVLDNAVRSLNAVKGLFAGERKKTREPSDGVQNAIQELAEGVGRFAAAIGLASPRRPGPHARVMGKRTDEETEPLLEVLRWTLRGDEELIGFAHARDSGRQAVIAITDQRVIEARPADLHSRGEFWREVPNDWIRYVRRRGGDEGRAELDVITKEENLTWSFGPADESDQAGLDAITGMLAERMRLPEEEMRELTGSRSDGAPRIGAPARAPFPAGGHSGQSDSE